jgi:acyl dehydratase
VADFELPVEAGLVALFARAIGDPNPRYRSGSPEADAAGGAVTPPTFAMVADAFDPDFPRRPPLDAAVTDEGPTTHEALLHVSQDFAYARPVRVGEVLTVRRRPERTWTKQGRTGGLLEFIETVTELVADDGTVVVSSAWTDVRPERGHRQMSVEQPAVAAPQSRPGAGSVVALDLSPTRIAMYVGIAGDFHPLHHDDVYARANGYPSVFVPGMLTMALTGRAVTDVVGPANLRSFGGRLTGQVWPGATLRTTVVPGDGDGHGLDRYVVTTTDQDGRTVFAGTAEATQDGER